MMKYSFEIILKSILKNKQFTPIFCAGNSFRSDGPMLDYIKEQTGIGLFFSNKQIDERIEKLVDFIAQYHSKNY